MLLSSPVRTFDMDAMTSLNFVTTSVASSRLNWNANVSAPLDPKDPAHSHKSDRESSRFPGQYSVTFS